MVAWVAALCAIIGPFGLYDWLVENHKWPELPFLAKDSKVPGILFVTVATIAICGPFIYWEERYKRKRRQSEYDVLLTRRAQIVALSEKHPDHAGLKEVVSAIDKRLAIIVQRGD